MTELLDKICSWIAPVIHNSGHPRSHCLAPPGAARAASEPCDGRHAPHPGAPQLVYGRRRLPATRCPTGSTRSAAPFLEIEIDSPDRERFSARLDQFDLGPATVSLVQADSQSIRRTPERIARSGTRASSCFSCAPAGWACSSTDANASSSPGDSVLIDCNGSYRLECLG